MSEKVRVPVGVEWGNCFSISLNFFGLSVFAQVFLILLLLGKFFSDATFLFSCLGLFFFSKLTLQIFWFFVIFEFLSAFLFCIASDAELPLSSV